MSLITGSGLSSLPKFLSLQPVKGRSIAMSPHPSSTASTPHVHIVAPFPGPAVSISDTVSPSTDCVFRQNSVSSNESSEGGGQSPPGTTEQAQNSPQPNVEVEITNREKKSVRNDNRERGSICTSPEDLIKIEAFHNSISELAGHFTTILFSESGEEVVSSSL